MLRLELMTWARIQPEKSQVYSQFIYSNKCKFFELLIPLTGLDHIPFFATLVQPNDIQIANTVNGRNKLYTRGSCHVILR